MGQRMIWQIIDTDARFYRLYWSPLYLLEINRQESESYLTVDYDFKRMKGLLQGKTDAKPMQRVSGET